MKLLRRYWWVLLAGSVVIIPVSLYAFVALTARAAHNRHQAARFWLQHVLSQPGDPQGSEQDGELKLYRVVGLVNAEGERVDDVLVTWPPERYTFDSPDAAVLVMRPNAWLHWDIWHVESGELAWLDFDRIALDEDAATLRPSADEWAEPQWHAGFNASVPER